MNYKELNNIKKKENITYLDLLELDEWKSKREEILEKNQHKCTKCCSEKSIGPFYSGSNKLWGRKVGNETKLEEKRIFLEIHHKYYISNLLPWEYDDALITLCSNCHYQTQQEEEISIYADKSMTTKLCTENCTKCGGSGFLSEYDYYKNGICFDCQGIGMRIPFDD